MKQRYIWLACAALAAAAALWFALQREPPMPRKTAEAVARIEWHDCVEAVYSEVPMECGRYYPGGSSGTFYLPFVIFRYTGSDARRDPLVYVAGGPGAGMQTHDNQLQGWAYWLQEAGLKRDLVIYDQRGLKPGEPYWDCDAYRRVSEELLAEDLSVVAENRLISPVLDKCLAEFDRWLRQPGVGVKQGLRSFNSRQAADELNRMLALLGYPRWNLWGVSYGTRLALVAAQQQPQRVRSLLLDSPYPLDRGEAAASLKLYAQALERFWRFCADNATDCGASVTDPEALYWRVVEQLNAEPVRLRVPGADVASQIPVVLNGQRFVGLSLFALYDYRFYTELLQAMVALDSGSDASGDDESQILGPLKLLVGSLVTSAFDPDFNTLVYFAIECNDNPLSTAQDWQAAVQAHPKLGRLVAWDAGDDICRQTFFESSDLLSAEPAPTMPTLVLSGELDPVTPTRWARRLVGQLPQARLVTVRGIGHAVFGSEGCELGLMRDFLRAPERVVAGSLGKCQSSAAAET